MIELGTTVILVGKTLKGKNRVRNIGSEWTVIAHTDRVLFSPGKVGNWLHIEPVNSSSVDRDRLSRWVNLDDDPDFTVTIVGKNT